MKVLDPAEIRYTQTRFSRSFTRCVPEACNNYSQNISSKDKGNSSSNASHPSSSLPEVLNAKEPALLLEFLLSRLLSGDITIDSIDPISVFFYSGSWYSLDNRRLWVFKQLGKPIPVKITTSFLEFLQKFQEDGDNQSATFLPDSPVHERAEAKTEGQDGDNQSATFLPDPPAHKRAETKTEGQDGDKQSATFLPKPTAHKRAKAKTGGQEGALLLDHVFQWTTHDIMNDSLLKNKVKPIPRRFGSLEEYLDSFKCPLLEEVRAQLKQSLELIKQAPHAPVSKVFKLHSKTKRVLKNFEKFMIYVDREHLGRSPKEHERRVQFRPKDLIFLSSKLPKSVEELGDSRENMMALVEGVQDGPLLLRILVNKRDAEAAHQELLDQRRTWYVIYLLGLATSWRICRALHPADMKNAIFPIIQKTLNYDPHQNTPRQDEAPSTECLKKSIVTYCSSVRLNESQTNAVVNAVCHVKNKSDPGVRMIQGPPGTGKTSTVVTLLSVASSLGMKCLVTCPTNTAIAEVAVRYMEMLKSPQKIQFGEFCKSTACPLKVGPKPRLQTCKVVQRRDVVLVGNENKLPLQGSLREIYLPYRVKRIRKANRSWREVALSLFQFITSGKSEYRAQQEKITTSGPHMSFLEFARTKLVNLVKQLEEHGNTLVEELIIDHAHMFSKTARLTALLVDRVLEPAISEQDFSTWFANNQSRLNLVKHLRQCLSSKKASLLSEQSIERLCMKSSALVFCTVSTAGRLCVKQAAPFDCVIIDEAAQLVEAETAIITCSLGVNHAVLVGDHQQLPATVISQVDSAYGRSLFERMISLGHPCHLLNTQYRMHPSISLFPNSNFYEGRLLDGENVRSPSYRVHEQLLYGSYAFIDVNDGVEQSDNNGRSKKNSVEAAVIISMIKKLCEASLENNIQKLTVGIITPYSCQKDLLIRCLKKERTERLIVNVNSVDGFQGQEKDIIILSTVRANQSGDIGFLKDDRRLNVAITRAKYCLWIVGSIKTLSAKPNIWRNLLQDGINRGLYRSSANDGKLGKKIIKAKNDLDKFSDILQMGSALFTNTLWKVVFSNDFKNSFLRINSVGKRQQIVDRIRQLSSGHHLACYKMDTVPAMKTTKGLIEVHKVADLYLVWGIDVERGATMIQIIKVWDALSFSNLPKCIKRLEAAFEAYSLQHIKRCKVRYLSRDNNLTSPTTWDDDLAKKTLQQGLHSLDPRQEEHSVWVKARMEQVQKTDNAAEHKFGREPSHLEAGADEDGDDYDETKEEGPVLVGSSEMGSIANQAGSKNKSKKNPTYKKTHNAVDERWSRKGGLGRLSTL